MPIAIRRTIYRVRGHRGRIIARHSSQEPWTQNMQQKVLFFRRSIFPCFRYCRCVLEPPWRFVLLESVSFCFPLFSNAASLALAQPLCSRYLLFDHVEQILLTCRSERLCLFFGCRDYYFPLRPIAFLFLDDSLHAVSRNIKRFVKNNSLTNN